MQLETLSCNNCGAPLKVPETANFVTCNHCDTQLVIRRTEGVTFTEQLQDISDKTDQLTEVVTQLARQNRIAMIDRHWDRERESYMMSDQQGGRHLPSETRAVVAGVVVAIVGIVWMVMAAGVGAGEFSLFGLVFLVFGGGVAIYQYQQAKDYRAAHRRYRRRRRGAARQNLFDQPGESFANVSEIPTSDDYLRQLQQEG